MKVIEINIPDNVKIEKDELINLLAIDYYLKGKLTIAECSKLTNMETLEFLKIVKESKSRISNFEDSEYTPFQELLLNGPVLNQEEIESLEENIKSVIKWKIV